MVRGGQTGLGPVGKEQVQNFRAQNKARRGYEISGVGRFLKLEGMGPDLAPFVAGIIGL